VTHLKRFVQAFTLALGASVSLTILSLIWLAMVGGFYLLFDILRTHQPVDFVMGWLWISLGVASLYTMFKIKEEGG
jgi:hypothetical protein